MGMYVGPGLCNISFCGQAQKQIGEGVARENSLVKRKRAKIVGAPETLKVLVAHMARVDAKLHGMATLDPAQIVGELDRLRLGGAIFVPANRRVVARIIAEIKDGKSAGVRMLARVETGQPKSGNCRRAFNRKIDLELPKRDPEARFVHEVIRDEVVVRNDEIVVAFGVLIWRQVVVHGVQGRIGERFGADTFPAPSYENRLFRTDGAI